METVKERLKYFLKTIPNSKGKVGMGELEFENKTGLSRSAVSNIRNSLGPDSVKKIKAHYPNLNEIWLLHGQGKMLLNEEKAVSQMDDIADKSSSLEDIIASNKLLAQAHLKQVENNSSLIKLLEKSSATEDAARRSQQDTDSMIRAIQKVIVDMGVNSGYYSSEKDGQNRFGKIAYDELTRGETSSSPDGVGTQNK